MFNIKQNLKHSILKINQKKFANKIGAPCKVHIRYINVKDDHLILVTLFLFIPFFQ